MLAVLFEGQRTSADTLCDGGGGLDGGGVDVVVVISGMYESNNINNKGC